MLSAVERVLFLMRAGLTGEATTDALARLAASAAEVEAERGQRLFEPGQEADGLWVVVDGVVRVDVERAAPRMAEPGDWLGALPLFAGGEHRSTATALTTTRLLRIDRTELYDLLDEDGELARALLTGLARGLRALGAGLVDAL
jgi:CRP/FNR family transcriptional regulator, cyclic AMP receptor protein